MDQEKQKANIYSAEFRESSVKLAIGSNQPITQTARDLGVNPNTRYIPGSTNIASQRSTTKSREPMTIYMKN